uniref:G-protein coupled receptors family 1 profile domain-containing protein n=1 Tax=Oryzias latipes TaxID=8090 RepID=A0A3P9M244_ORYLA
MNATSEGGNASGSFFTDVGKNVLVVILGLSINSVNATMVHTFRKHHVLRSNPRYVLFAHLVLNDMIQLTVSISVHVFSYTLRTIHVFICLLLILPAIISNMNTPLNLGVMATECFLSICFPLRYNNICTVRRTCILIGFIWAVSSLSVLPDVFILLATEQQHFFLSRVFCDRDNVFRSSYSKEKRNVSHILFFVLVWLTLFYTYFRVLLTAKAANADATKARSTILLHAFQVLLCMSTYALPFLLQLFRDLFPKQIVSIYFAFFVIIQIFPRFLSPIIYGLRDKTFRKYLSRYCLCVQTKA